MSLDAESYFQHLKAYVNSDYIKHDGVGGKVVLKEKYFRPGDTKPSERRIELLHSGLVMAFKLDNDELGQSTINSKPALFHFLDDNSKPWSKRCDFVIFYVSHKTFRADCIEFKSKSLTKDTVVPQLKAGTCWVRSLKRTIEHYTDYRQTIRTRKFVFAGNESPEAYLDNRRQLLADPSIRYYHFDEVHGMALTDLKNTSVEKI